MIAYVDTDLLRFRIAFDQHAQILAAPKPIKIPLLAECLQYWSMIKKAGDDATRHILCCPEYTSSMTFNVKDYGAKGDGITDDTAAIQKAYDRGKMYGVFDSIGIKTNG